MVFAVSAPAFATETVPETKMELSEPALAQSTDPIVLSNSDYLITEYEKIKGMSVEELNAYIDNIAASGATTNSGLQSIDIIDVLVLKAAWLAAAQVAKLAGYPCAAKAVEHSVLGTNYTEDDGNFAAKIKTTSTFTTFLSETKNSGKSSDSQVKEFTKSDDSDLFYALHNATITLIKSGTNYNVNVFDIFDFAFDNDYSGLFTTLVNNWAWLCQNTGVLNKITINVDFIA